MSSNALDLSKYAVASAAARGASMTLRDPFKKQPILMPDGKPFTISLLGDDAPAVRAAAMEVQDQRYTEMQTTGNRTVYTVASEMQEKLSKAVAATRGWSHPLTIGGQVVQFSPENARHVYGDPDYWWIRDQIIEFITERSHFFGGG